MAWHLFVILINEAKLHEKSVSSSAYFPCELCSVVGGTRNKEDMVQVKSLRSENPADERSTTSDGEEKKKERQQRKKGQPFPTDDWK